MPYNEVVPNPYRQENVPQGKTVGGLLGKYQAKLFAGESKQDVTEYQHYIGLASKLTGDTYMKMHRRISRAFPTETLSFVLSKLREWVHYAEKRDNKGMAFNGLFKKYRDATAETKLL